MINIKSGTQTWTNSPQQSSLKSDGAQNLSATERNELIGDQDLGAHLNKIADPNWVDPSKMRKVGNNELDKDAFLKLFLAQLKNQDPTNPMQNHELAAQLAQFTSLEKLNNIDTGISQMAKQSDPNKGFETLSLIGKGVSGDSSKILRTDNKAQHEIGFNLITSANEVELSVRNNAGQEVRKLVAHNLKPGANKLSWDGMLDAGNAAPEGEYNVVITAKNSSGQKVAAETRFQGRVSGVNFTAEGPVLMVGRQSIKLSDVKSIFDASELVDEAKLVQSQSIEGKDAKNLASSSVGMGGSLESVGMSQDLINRLEKEATAVVNQAENEENSAIEKK
ncbi:MAG: flagellar biosynthesis protein FlgD [Bdellovibrionales bacterium]|nr:flagellar biosynthesis protein FlgD [Bdellovibrionales bacterium]